MRAEKQLLTKEYAARLNASPFFIVVGYQGLKVAHLTELRKRLKTAGAEIHVVKNSVFRVAAKEAGVAELNGSLAGQMAVVTGQKDISAAAKALKNFAAEFDKLKTQVRLFEQPAARRSRHHRAGGFAEPRCAAREDSRPARRSGDEAGDLDQHAGVAVGAGHQGEVRKGRINNFRFETLRLRDRRNKQQQQRKSSVRRP